MKRFMMQLFRSVVTVIVVGTMAVMIFSLREELAMAKAKAARSAGGEPGLFETIAARTSIRAFDPSKAVSDADVEKMLRAAMCAPSAMNRQPWEFIVVRDPQKLSEIAQRMPNSRVANGATLAIVVCGAADNGLPGRAKEFWIHDCSAATMNLLLAAKALGLGAVWTGVYPRDEFVTAIREILSIPETHIPLNVIPVGHAAENPTPKDKWTPSKVHTNGW